MKLEMPSGKYVVAVSGGVDSMVLLDLLRLHPGLKLVVAHYDHGIREDATEDRLLVQEAAKRHNLPYIYDVGQLGPGTSEAVAREKRYAFLHKVREASGAQAIVTAHHQDDALETVVINLLRGTGRKGLSSLASTESVVRPLLGVAKSEIIDYAKRHNLQWREDSTNTNTDYLRNHIRHNVLPKWSEADKQRMLDIAQHMQRVNRELDDLLAEDTHEDLSREWFSLLPHNVAREVMATWLREHNVRDFDRSALERLTVAAKVAEPGKAIDVVKGHTVRVGKQHLALERPER